MQAGFKSFNFLSRMAAQINGVVFDQRGSEMSENAVVLVFFVLVGVAAFSPLGQKVVDMIGQVVAGI
jgi:hypothetical protein